MWSYDMIILGLILSVSILGVSFLLDVLLSSGELLSWAWEKIRILRRRDGQDV